MQQWLTNVRCDQTCFMRASVFSMCSERDDLHMWQWTHGLLVSYHVTNWGTKLPTWGTTRLNEEPRNLFNDLGTSLMVKLSMDAINAGHVLSSTFNGPKKMRLHARTHTHSILQYTMYIFISIHIFLRWYNLNTIHAYWMTHGPIKCHIILSLFELAKSGDTPRLSLRPLFF